ncbi:MAG: peptidoglycan-binding protein [Chloroflexi bacterium]|nr:peptidoglycan-binding protein [Chloroflexota bacterium]
MRLIAKGDRGDDVADVQRRLATLGYDIGAGGADGSFGADTEAAVRCFQEERKLSVSGVVSDETWRHLVEAGYTLGDRLLYLRTPFFRGDDVKRLQMWLNKLGFNTGRADGIFGQTTESAVREFQRNIGLVADGIVGDSTIAAFSTLRNVLEDSSSRVFPDPERASVLSAISGRQVAVDVGEGDSSDIAGRFGNLLEILGADIRFIPAQEIQGAELVVSFEGSVDQEKAVTFYEVDERFEKPSRLLALAVQKELKTTLDCLDEGVFPGNLGKGLPAIVVRSPLRCGPPDPSAREIFHQKIAVAVFDAVKSFLESAS